MLATTRRFNMSKLTNTIDEIMAQSAEASEKVAGETATTTPAFAMTELGSGMRKLASYLREQRVDPSYGDINKLLGDLDA
jgi:hypothetical protein